jgi:ABC-type multidrug transport system permease subunit
MQPIDRPFRFTPDFCVVWALLALPAFFLIRGSDSGPGYSQAAAVILLSLFATILVYGPVLLARQIVHSGRRGWFVLRVLLSILFAVFLFAGVLIITGQVEHIWSGIVAFVAIVYLHWRLRQDRPS